MISYFSSGLCISRYLNILFCAIALCISISCYEFKSIIFMDYIVLQGYGKIMEKRIFKKRLCSPPILNFKSRDKNMFFSAKKSKNVC